MSDVQLALSCLPRFNPAYSERGQLVDDVLLKVASARYSSSSCVDLPAQLLSREGDGAASRLPGSRWVNETGTSSAAAPAVALKAVARRLPTRGTRQIFRRVGGRFGGELLRPGPKRHVTASPSVYRAGKEEVHCATI